MFKKFHLVWPDKIALLLALLIAVGALLIWVSGSVGLADNPHMRFDAAMTRWTLEAEVMLVPPAWLFLRVLDMGARALGHVLRLGLARVRSGEWRLPIYPNAGIAANMD